MIKKIIKKLLFVFALMVVSISAVSAVGSNLSRDFMRIREIFHKQPHISNKVDLLFVQQAEKGEVIPLRSRLGCYVLKLRDMHRKVLYFSDQPERISGKLTVGEFVQTLENNAKHYGIKPNVAILAYGINNKNIREINQIAVLTNPKFNATQETVSYTACPINKENKVRQTRKFGDITLIFDSFHTWP